MDFFPDKTVSKELKKGTSRTNGFPMTSLE
jgi:hypothetical protein